MAIQVSDRVPDMTDPPGLKHELEKIGNVSQKSGTVLKLSVLSPSTSTRCISISPGCPSPNLPLLCVLVSVIRRMTLTEQGAFSEPTPYSS